MKVIGEDNYINVYSFKFMIHDEVDLHNQNVDDLKQTTVCFKNNYISELATRSCVRCQNAPLKWHMGNQPCAQSVFMGNFFGTTTNIKYMSHTTICLSLISSLGPDKHYVQ